MCAFINLTFLHLLMSLFYSVLCIFNLQDKPSQSTYKIKIAKEWILITKTVRQYDLYLKVEFILIKIIKL